MNINDAKGSLSDVCPGDLLVRWDDVTILVVEILGDRHCDDEDAMKYGRHMTYLTNTGEHEFTFMAYIEFMLTIKHVERGR